MGDCYRGDFRDEDKRKKKRLIVIFSIIFLVAVTVVVVFVSLNGGKRAKPTLEIDPNAGDWGYDLDFGEKNDKNGIQIPGYDSISVEKDKKNVKMNLANPKDNKCYFNFKIILDDTAETIYESKAVPPGQSIRNVTLTKPLSAGNYDSTIEISTLALDGVTTLNGARTKVHLIAR